MLTFKLQFFCHIHVTFEFCFSIKFATITIIISSNGNKTEWSTIQGVIGRVVSKSAERTAQGRFEIKSTITPELYNTKSYY